MQYLTKEYAVAGWRCKRGCGHFCKKYTEKSRSEDEERRWGYKIGVQEIECKIECEAKSIQKREKVG